MNKKVFEIMLKDADTFSTGDLWILNFEGQRIRFSIKLDWFYRCSNRSP